jgi:hypothetical protein
MCKSFEYGKIPLNEKLSKNWNEVRTDIAVVVDSCHWVYF